MQHSEKESKSNFAALEVCEAKRAEALHSMLDGVNIAYHPGTEEDKFIPYILDLTELPRAIDEIMPVSTLDPTEYDTLLERLARSIPAVH